MTQCSQFLICAVEKQSPQRSESKIWPLLAVLYGSLKVVGDSRKLLQLSVSSKGHKSGDERAWLWMQGRIAEKFAWKIATCPSALQVPWGSVRILALISFCRPQCSKDWPLFKRWKGWSFVRGGRNYLWMTGGRSFFDEPLFKLLHHPNAHLDWIWTRSKKIWRQTATHSSMGPQWTRCPTSWTEWLITATWCSSSSSAFFLLCTAHKRQGLFWPSLVLPEVSSSS